MRGCEPAASINRIWDISNISTALVGLMGKDPLKRLVALRLYGCDPYPSMTMLPAVNHRSLLYNIATAGEDALLPTSILYLQSEYFACHEANGFPDGSYVHIGGALVVTTTISAARLLSHVRLHRLWRHV